MAGESAREYARRQREKAERHTRVAEMYERGAEGESETAARLDALKAHGWVLFHDVRWPGSARANIDHVAIGPGGVFVIDSKNWSGSITVRDDVLRQGGRQRERAVSGAAEAALAITGILGQVPAIGVLCFVRDEPLTGWARDVMICSTATITSMLGSRAPTLHPAAVDRFTRQLRAQLSSANAPATPSNIGQYSHRRPRPTRAQYARRAATIPHSKSPRTFGRRVLGLGIAALFLLILLGVAEAALSGVRSGVNAALGATTPIGKSVDIRASGIRPELSVTAVRVVPTSVQGRTKRPTPNQKLVAVHVRIQNRGSRPWSWSPSGTSMSVLDSHGLRYSPEPYRMVTAGRVLAPTRTVAPERAAEGYVVFALPKPAVLKEVDMTFGPGYPESVRWQVDR